MSKKDLLDKIIKFYEESDDFNGISTWNLDSSNIKYLVELVNDGMIEAISERDILNPHIKGFNMNLSKEYQIKTIEEWKGCICFYPTEEALKNVEVDYSKPYTALLQKGKEQFFIKYFSVEVLERYINNPKYEILDSGYRGKVYLKDEYYSDDEEYEYIKDYGMAYIDGPVLNRAVGVFLRDLSNLSPNIQMLWRSFELPNQENCVAEKGFIKNLIYGQWVDKYWIFDAVLDEMKIINEMCKAIGIPYMFNRVYGTGYYERPEGYKNILLPTLKNYYDFVSVIEKLVIHNISVKMFINSTSTVKAIDRKDENGKDKGSLIMLKEWLNKNVRSQFDVDKIIITPLRDIRKIRQIPAHELYPNEYDINVYGKQKDLIIDVYFALKGVRVLLQGHPLAKTVKIPEYLVTGADIVFY